MPSGCAGASCSCARRRSIRSSASSEATWPGAAGRSTAKPGPCAGFRFRKGSWSRAALQTRSSRRRPRQRSAITTRTSASPGWSRRWRTGRRGAARQVGVDLLGCSRARCEARHHHRRHQVRVRRDRWPSHPRRRGAYAGLEPFLAGEQLRARRWSAQLRQAVRSRLAGGEWLGQDAAGSCLASRRDRSHQQQVHPSVRADHRSYVRARRSCLNGPSQCDKRAIPEVHESQRQDPKVRRGRQAQACGGRHAHSYDRASPRPRPAAPDLSARPPRSTVGGAASGGSCWARLSCSPAGRGRFAPTPTWS